MTGFHHILPMTVRYSDLDAQGHVNNTRYATYIESGRLAYLKDLGLWDGKDFMNLGVIVADLHISYRQQILLGQPIEVATRVVHLGNKSIKFEFQISDSGTGEVLSTAESINVRYDYRTGETISISAEWREVINRFEGTQF